MTPAADERFARLRLARTDRIGPVAFSQLLGRYGSAVRVLEVLPDLVRKSGAASIPPPVAGIERELADGERIGARLLVLGDPDYPEMLANLDPPPPILWARGRVDLLNMPSIAILCEGIEDIERAFNTLRSLRAPPSEPMDYGEVDDAFLDRVAALLSPTPTPRDEIARALNAPMGQVAAALLELSLAGRAELLPGGLASI